MLSPVETLIQSLYHTYRHTSDIDKKGVFFSPRCMQICRPIPVYAATTREQIVQYLEDAQEGNVPVDSATSESHVIASAEETKSKDEGLSKNEPKVDNKDVSTENVAESRGVYTIRPLHASEQADFSTAAITASINLTPAQLLQRSRDENWIGMRVDLWDEGAAKDDSLLVKVQYWWRKEVISAGEDLEGDENGQGWRQCLHDIMYLGPKDGKEGEEGLEVRK